MRYEKPIVMDLGVRARAAGQEPLGCWSGGAFIYGNPCAVGDGNWSCIGGTSATYETCADGPAVVPGGLCAAGGVPAAQDICTTGPGPV